MKKTDGVTAAALFLTVILLCVFSSEAKVGALGGIRMCEEVIIPSLLSMLILCNLTVKSRASVVFEVLFGSFFEKALKLPRCAAPAVITGLMGGYPAGAVLTLGLYQSGLIDSAQAKRIMRFNLSGGCAFIITAVGTVTYSSTKTGAVLFIVCNAANLIIMLFSGVGKSESIASGARDYSPLSDALPDSVEAAVKSVMNLSAYIIVFSALCSVFKLPVFLYPVLEITTGVCFRDVPLPLPFCAFFLSFGGLCVHFQIFGILKKMKTSYLDFLIHRLLAGVISFALAGLYCAVFPESAEVFENTALKMHGFSSGGAGAGIVMIIGCAVLIFDIENRKLKLI